LEEAAKKDLEIAESVNEEEYEDTGDGIECGCCFATYPFVSEYMFPHAVADRHPRTK
jgi:TRIAD3 protein (E3 ubiquitin-protein ligase RNF216)